MKAPFPWFGGKSRAVEPFAGSLAVLLARPHEMPREWECVAWKARGGYGSQSSKRGRDNANLERIWLSPACLKPETQGLLDL